MAALTLAESHAGSGLPSSIDPRLLRRGREVYEESRLFHGTTTTSRESIKQQGFRRRAKTPGGMAGWESVSSESISQEKVDRGSAAHYMTNDRLSAKRYATLSAQAPRSEIVLAGQQRPALVRTIGVLSTCQNINKDPDSRSSDDNPNFALRIATDISKNHVLNSKSAPLGIDADIFKSEMGRSGLRLSTREAGQLLRAVQSDSEEEDEFPHEDLMHRLKEKGFAEAAVIQISTSRGTKYNESVCEVLLELFEDLTRLGYSRRDMFDLSCGQGGDHTLRTAVALTPDLVRIGFTITQIAEAGSGIAGGKTLATLHKRADLFLREGFTTDDITLIARNDNGGLVAQDVYKTLPALRGLGLGNREIAGLCDRRSPRDHLKRICEVVPKLLRMGLSPESLRAAIVQDGTSLEVLARLVKPSP